MTVQDDLVRWCESKEGTPYRYGGTGPDYDCSGLVQAAYREVAHLEIGRDTAAQQSHGWPIGIADAIPSDLCFFGDLAGEHAHVGMFIGGGRMVNAPHTGAVVRIDSVQAWSDSGERLRGFRRYIAPPTEADLPLSADDLSKITTIVQQQIANETRAPSGAIFRLMADLFNNQFMAEFRKIENKIGA